MIASAETSASEAAVAGGAAGVVTAAVGVGASAGVVGSGTTLRGSAVVITIGGATLIADIGITVGGGACADISASAACISMSVGANRVAVSIGSGGIAIAHYPMASVAGVDIALTVSAAVVASDAPFRTGRGVVSAGMLTGRLPLLCPAPAQPAPGRTGRLPFGLQVAFGRPQP